MEAAWFDAKLGAVAASPRAADWRCAKLALCQTGVVPAQPLVEWHRNQLSKDGYGMQGREGQCIAVRCGEGQCGEGQCGSG